MLRTFVRCLTSQTAGLNVDEVYQCDDLQKAENFGLTPCGSDGSLHKVSSITNNAENEDSLEEDEDIISFPVHPKRRISRNMSIFEGQSESIRPEEIMRRHRRMSTISQKLDKLLITPAIEMAKEASFQSQNSKPAGSQASLTNFYRRQSILREHDIM